MFFDGRKSECVFSFKVVNSDYDITLINLKTGMCFVCSRIQAYITPNIPNPKATLAQIHREKEVIQASLLVISQKNHGSNGYSKCIKPLLLQHPPVSFSPEIFSDKNITRVVYAEEKQLAPESDEGQKDSTGSCESETQLSRCSWPASQREEQDEDDRRIEAEMSHLKIRLLDRLEEEEVGLATLQRDCRDETYVTMSSLYKTQ